MQWLELNYRENFFLYIDTWDPHEPWNAPDYFTELYWPGYDGELIRPLYDYWKESPAYPEKRVKKRMPLIVERSPWWIRGLAT